MAWLRLGLLQQQVLRFALVWVQHWKLEAQLLQMILWHPQSRKG